MKTCMLISYRIPFDRALDFANREKITELLYPLFVHNIGALLYHPTNSTRTNMVMQASERRKMQDKQQHNSMLGPPGSQPPALHHHHSMNSGVGSHVAQSPHSIAPYPRPGIDRAHTFPTPPTSASSTMGMSSQGNPCDWGAQSMGGGVQGSQPLSIDTGLSNTRSMPSTPATTPPGNMMPNMQQPYQNQQPYDNTRSVYSAAPSQQSHYTAQQNIAQQNIARFGPPMQSNPYIKNEMGPPTSRTTGSGTENDHGDHKNDPYAQNQGNEQVGHGTGEEEAEHEHDTDYAHDNSAAYNANRGTYNYNPGPSIGSMHGEHPHLSPEQLNGSPSHQNPTSRGAVRNATVTQPQWAPGYHTPPRMSSASSVYNVMSDARGSIGNGNNVGENYVPVPLPPTYAPSTMNGSTSTNKRMRDEDEPDLSRPASRGDNIEALKRRKTVREGSVSTPVASSFDRDGRPIQRTKSTIVARRS